MNKVSLLCVGVLIVVLVFAGCNCDTETVTYNLEFKNNTSLSGELGDYVDVEFEDLKNDTIKIKFPEGTKAPKTVLPSTILNK